MTIEEIKKRIQEIKNCQDDPEKAHSKEDELYHDFIKSLLKEVETNQNFNVIENLKKAKLILETEELEFSRRFA